MDRMTIIARENQNPFRPHSAAALFRAGPPRGSDLLAWTPPSSVRDVGNSSSRSDSPPSAAATIRLAMPGTNTIALVSVIAGAVTAVSVPLITVVGQRRENRRRFEEDRLVKDFDELRILLDDCAQAINVYIGALERTENRYYESDTSDPGYYSEQLDYLRGRSATASHLNQRLVIRLGRQRPVVKAFGAAIAPLDAGYTSSRIGSSADSQPTSRSGSVNTWLRPEKRRTRTTWTLHRPSSGRPSSRLGLTMMSMRLRGCARACEYGDTARQIRAGAKRRTPLRSGLARSRHSAASSRCRGGPSTGGSSE
jgi:hypothetical protein